MHLERKPQYLRHEPAGRERWLISYADVLTVLLILFVAMAAGSPGKQSQRPDPPRPQPAAAIAPPQPAPQAPTPLQSATASRENLIQAEQKLQQHGLDVRLEPRGLVITLPQAILFESGEDRINASAVPIISQIADALANINNKVELAGYADTVPIHNRRFKNNWELSAARSLSLLNLLASRYGIDESRLSVSSYGSHNPKSSNETADGRAGNRRVEVLIRDAPASL